MEHLRTLPPLSLFLGIIILGIFFSGCVAELQSSDNQLPGPDVNSTAIAIALNDTRMKLYLTHDGNYTILGTGSTKYEIGHTSIKVTGVEIDTPVHRFYVYVDVKNGSVVDIWPRPKRVPIPHGQEV